MNAMNLMFKNPKMNNDLDPRTMLFREVPNQNRYELEYWDGSVTYFLQEALKLDLVWWDSFGKLKCNCCFGPTVGHDKLQPSQVAAWNLICCYMETEVTSGLNELEEFLVDMDDNWWDTFAQHTHWWTMYAWLFVHVPSLKKLLDRPLPNHIHL